MIARNNFYPKKTSVPSRFNLLVMVEYLSQQHETSCPNLRSGHTLMVNTDCGVNSLFPESDALDYAAFWSIISLWFT